MAFSREASPFLRESTNILLNTANYQILSTFLISLVLITNSLSTFGLHNLALGSLLVCLNLALVLLSAFWCYGRWRVEQERKQWRRALTTQQLRIVENVMMGRGNIEDSLNRITMMGDSFKDSTKSIELVKTPDRDVEERTTLELSKHLLDPKDVKMSKRIGAGSFGEVFKGSCHGQAVAIKTMKDVTEVNVRSFRSEIILTAALRHPNVVQFIGACWGRDLMCLVLEWIPKGSLGDMISDYSLELRWDNPLLRLATDVARGMAYLHGRRYFDEKDGCFKNCIIHRDLKPDNCLVTEFLSAKITDFGTSRAKSTEEDVTMTAVGTPLFCAPEIFRGELYDEKVDVYSFGLLLLSLAIDTSLIELMGQRWMIAFKKKQPPAKVK